MLRFNLLIDDITKFDNAAASKANGYTRPSDNDNNTASSPLIARAENIVPAPKGTATTAIGLPKKINSHQSFAFRQKRSSYKTKDKT